MADDKKVVEYTHTRISKTYLKKLQKLAKKSKRSAMAQLEHLIDQADTPKGFEVLSVCDLPLDDTTHEKMFELMGGFRKLDLIQMRNDQWVKLIGNSLVPAGEAIYYRGVETRLYAKGAKQ